jgi:hypothetical protein
MDVPQIAAMLRLLYVRDNLSRWIGAWFSLYVALNTSEGLPVPAQFVLLPPPLGLALHALKVTARADYRGSGRNQRCDQHIDRYIGTWIHDDQGPTQMSN